MQTKASSNRADSDYSTKQMTKNKIIIIIIISKLIKENFNESLKMPQFGNSRNNVTTPYCAQNPRCGDFCVKPKSCCRKFPLFQSTDDVSP